MPKMKTHKGAAKRFKVTGTGKLTRRKAFMNHILEKKPSKRKRRLSGEREVTGGDAPHEAPARPLSPPTRRTTANERRQPWPRVKRSVHAKKHRRAILERAQGYYGNKSRSYRAANEQVMHSPAVRLPRPPGPQGRLPHAVDPAHQRRLPPARHELQPVHRRAAGRRHRGRPQGPRRPRRHRPGRLRRPGRSRHARRATASRVPETAPDAGADGARGRRRSSSGCGACSAAGRARDAERASSSRARRCSPTPIAAGVELRRASYAEPGARADRRRGGRPCRTRVAAGVLASASPTPSPPRPSPPSPGCPTRHARPTSPPAPRCSCSSASADPGNAGTLLRSAEAAGVGAVLFCGGFGRPVVARSACGRRPGRCSVSGGQREGSRCEVLERGRGDRAAHARHAVADAARPTTDADLTGRSPSCSATRPTACRRGRRPLDDWVHHPDGRARRVAQRRHGRHAPLLRGRCGAVA